LVDGYEFGICIYIIIYILSTYLIRWDGIFTGV